MPNHMSVRTVAGGVLGGLLLLGLIYAFWPRPVPADMVAVTRGPLAVTVDEEGRTRVKEVYTVSAPVAGRLLRIRAEAGDAVVKGRTVIATIQPTDPSFLDARSRTQAEASVKAADAARSLAKADVARAEAELDFARSELARAKQLAAKGNVSQSALDRAQLEMRTRAAALGEARAALKMRDFELENARALLIQPGGDGTDDKEPEGDADVTASACCVPVRAPISGRVLRVLQESEAVIPAGTPLVELGDDNDLEIEVDLLSADAVRVTEGDRVLIEDWGGDEDLNGIVRRIEPFGFTKISALGIEEQRVNVIIDFTDPPEKWAALGHGFRLDTRIFVWEGTDVLTVPVAALFRDGEDWAVFRVEDGDAMVRHVSIGHRNALSAEVLEGLAEGDEVIVHPSDRISDGQSVSARNGH